MEGKIGVKETPLPPGGIEELGRGSDGEDSGKESNSELLPEVSNILLQTALGVLSDVAAKITKCDDVALTQEEVDTLVTVWQPLLPSMSPMTIAVVTTVTILAGKAVIYASFRAKQRGSIPETNPRGLNPGESNAQATPAAA